MLINLNKLALGINEHDATAALALRHFSHSSVALCAFVACFLMVRETLAALKKEHAKVVKNKKVKIWAGSPFADLALTFFGRGTRPLEEELDVIKLAVRSTMGFVDLARNRVPLPAWGAS